MEIMEVWRSGGHVDRAADAWWSGRLEIWTSGSRAGMEIMEVWRSWRSWRFRPLEVV